jgi:hypothetical protein
MKRAVSIVRRVLDPSLDVPFTPSVRSATPNISAKELEFFRRRAILVIA